MLPEHFQKRPYATGAMFYEHRHKTTSPHSPIFTLKEYDWEGCQSIYLLYMAYETEYEAAQAILGSWHHWQALCKTTWFSEAKAEWDEERDIREKSLAKKTLLAQAEEGNVTAAKSLLSGEKPRGRPKNKDDSPKDDSKDVDRLEQRFHAVKGGKG